jgi:hypothetical protein
MIYCDITIESSNERVLVNEFHQFYCNFNNRRLTVGNSTLGLYLITEAASRLYLAESFAITQLIESQSVRAKILNPVLIFELEDSFEVDLYTDRFTLLAINET